MSYGSSITFGRNGVLPSKTYPKLLAKTKKVQVIRTFLCPRVCQKILGDLRDALWRYPYLDLRHRFWKFTSRK